MKKVIKLTESDLYRIIKRVISEQDPEKEPKQTTMDSNWYADKIKNYIWWLLDFMKSKDLFEMEPDFRHMYQNFPKKKENVMKYSIIPLGKLISPNDPNPGELGLKFLHDLITNQRIRSYKKDNLPGGKFKWIDPLNDNPRTYALKRQIESTKNTPAPN